MSTSMLLVCSAELYDFPKRHPGRERCSARVTQDRITSYLVSSHHLLLPNFQISMINVLNIFSILVIPFDLRHFLRVKL